jgi:acyl carrier protein
MAFATQAALERETLEALSSVLLCDVDKLTPGAILAEDLGMDSLDRTEIVLMLEENVLEDLAIDEAEADGWKTVADVLATVREAAKK